MKAEPNALHPRVGLLGGTFNPVHRGHLHLAQNALEQLSLQEIRFIPCSDPPHKEAGNSMQMEEILAPAHLRASWLEAALESRPHFRVERIELERAGPSYTVDTLRLLQKELGLEKPVFLIGEDAFAELDTWKDPEEVCTLTHFAVATRPSPHPDGDLPVCVQHAYQWNGDRSIGHHQTAGTWIRRLSIPPLEISATEIRQRLRKGEKVRYLLPTEVVEAIENSEIYGPKERGS